MGSLLASSRVNRPDLPCSPPSKPKNPSKVPRYVPHRAHLPAAAARRYLGFSPHAGLVVASRLDRVPDRATHSSALDHSCGRHVLWMFLGDGKAQLNQGTIETHPKTSV